MSADRGRSDACHGPDNCAGPWGSSSPPARVDPADTTAARRRLALVLQETPEGVNLPVLADRVFDAEEPTRADRQWLRRECERQGHTVKRPTAKRAVRTSDGYENRETAPDLTWIFPRGSPVEPNREPTLDNSSGRSVEFGNLTQGNRASRAATNAAQAVNSRRRIHDWGGLIAAFASKRLGEERGCMEQTRFNTQSRALRGADAVARAFAGAAAEGYRRGVVITATTDPSRYDSILAASDGLLDDARALRDKLGRDADLGGRPPGVTVVEPTATGIPHVHIAAFGVAASDLDRDALKSFWVGRGRGHQVDLALLRRKPPTRADPLAWTWAGASSRTPERPGCPPATYLAAGSQALAAVARRDASDLEETPDDALRQAAWYFSTGAKTATRASPSLREAAPEASASDLLRDASDPQRPSHTSLGQLPVRIRIRTRPLPLAGLTLPVAVDRPPPVACQP